MDCTNLDCEEPASDLLRYQAPDREHRYTLCPYHLDRAHEWLAARPTLAVTAISERLTAPLDQPALF
ncbi:hypothetical protein [Nocardiopsis sp. NRRL B-16309]|uniref:hypothetical protein n=1 Tax=Nocardiopsis sp. NRRL B-16309 TaxID=1519494 RepID=UPI0006AD98F4|nr:hypothetical protein [Nocardiopsis sp. NRRL B-16309]KOX11838.1 hypothetical protein ADL05_23035 [Nocardiopsis sp. NRRL B-16309]